MTSPSELAHALTSRFLVVEGVDGSGKSTQVQQLAAWVQTLGVDMVVTREPGGTMLGEALRSLVLHTDAPCAPRAELLMMLAARAQHVAEVIQPALRAGRCVISDRFSLSSLAYQGYGRGLDLDEISRADAVATGTVSPDLTIVVDVSMAVLRERIGERQDRFEGEGRHFLQRVIDGYRALAAQDSAVRLVDGTGTVDEVRATIQAMVTAWATTARAEERK